MRTTLPFNLRVGATARHGGAQYCADRNATGELRLGASNRFDIDATRLVRLTPNRVLSRLDVTAAVDNVTDVAIYDQCGLPQPGRTFRLQFRMR